MPKQKTKGQKALAAAMRPVAKGDLTDPGDLINLMEASPGEERAKKRREMVIRREIVLNAMSPKRRNKHGNNVSYDADGKWDSDAEKRRWPILKALQKAGEIFDLRRQVRIPLHALRSRGWNTEPEMLVGYYIADFVYNKTKGLVVDYHLLEEGETKSPKYPLRFHSAAVVEDVKGQRTPLFKFKSKMFKAEYGFAIKEIKV